MKVLAIGQIMLDQLTLVEVYPEEGTKITPNSIETSIGGSAVNALAMLSKLGVECTLIAAIGDDEHGRLVVKQLEEEGIRFIPRIQKQTKVHTAIINMSNGSRTIIKDTVISDPITDIPEEIIKEHDMIIFDRHVRDSFEEVLEKKRPETKTLVDPSIEVSKDTLYMIENADYPIIPIEILEEYSKDRSLEENLYSIYAMTKKPIVVTMGSNGTITFDGKILKHYNPVDVKAVDTLGAGDVFRGVFAYGVLNNWDIEKTITLANYSAALQCTKIGGVSAIPTKQEIYEFRKTAATREIDLEYIGFKQFRNEQIKTQEEVSLKKKDIENKKINKLKNSVEHFSYS
ncbi:MAG TPA: PfkB family carbohydrate kinase [Candidatus Dojkabacteria bacterium]|jgi:sugar/nucleoside kinase (ribokinase family)